MDAQVFLISGTICQAFSILKSGSKIPVWSNSLSIHLNWSLVPMKEPSIVSFAPM